MTFFGAVVGFLLAGFLGPTYAAEAEMEGSAGMVFIKGGGYEPLFRDKPAGKVTDVVVGPFFLDAHPVTNEEYFRFVYAVPEWRSSHAKKLLVGDSYLKHWAGDTPVSGTAEEPVRYVSWFAANRYCESRGKRLPTTAEWEFAALASERSPDGRREEAYLQRILEWYGRPAATRLPKVKSTPPNYWGVYDMHGVVWEWVSDFNSALVTGESRSDTALERDFYCGAGAMLANEKDRVNYAAFMRYGYRSSLEGNYSIASLGFRCARSVN